MAAITAIGIGCHCSADYNVTCRSLRLAWFGSADQSGWRRNISDPSEIASTKSKNEKGWERKKNEHEKNDIDSRYLKMLQQNMSPCPSMSPRHPTTSTVLSTDGVLHKVVEDSETFRILWSNMFQHGPYSSPHGPTGSRTLSALCNFRFLLSLTLSRFSIKQ